MTAQEEHDRMAAAVAYLKAESERHAAHGRLEQAEAARQHALNIGEIYIVLRNGWNAVLHDNNLYKRRLAEAGLPA